MFLVEQVFGEKYFYGCCICVYVVVVCKEVCGLQVIVLCIYLNLVCKFFVMEVFEIEQGVVEIKVLVCEVGYCLKIVVVLYNFDVFVKGVCIGLMGQWVCVVMYELDEEKIDIIDWLEDLVEFVGVVLFLFKVFLVMVIDLKVKIVWVIVLDYQLLLVIGCEGQNV